MECLQLLLVFLLAVQICFLSPSVGLPSWIVTESAEKTRSACMLSRIDFHTDIDTTSFADLLAHFRSLIDKCIQNSTASMSNSGTYTLQRISPAANDRKNRKVRQTVGQSSSFSTFLANSKLVVRSENSNMTIAQLVHIESGQSSISFSLWETHISISAENVNLSVNPAQQIIVFVLVKPRLFIQRGGSTFNFSSPFSNLSMQPALGENGQSSCIKMVVTSDTWDFSGQCETIQFNVMNSSTKIVVINLKPAVTSSSPKFLSLAKHLGKESAFLFATADGLALEAELQDSTITLEENALRFVHTQTPSMFYVQTQTYRVSGSADDFMANMSKSEFLLHCGNSQIRMTSSAFLAASFLNARMIVSAMNSSRSYADHTSPESLSNAELDVAFSFLNLTIEPTFKQVAISAFNSSTVINRQSPSIKIMSNYSTMMVNSNLHVINIFTDSWLQIISSPNSKSLVDKFPAARKDTRVPFNVTQSQAYESPELLEVIDQDPEDWITSTEETVNYLNLLTRSLPLSGESIPLAEGSAPMLAPLQGNITVEGMHYLHQDDSLDSELSHIATTEFSTSSTLSHADEIAIESDIIKIQEVNSNKIQEVLSTMEPALPYSETLSENDAHPSGDGMHSTEKSPTSRRAVDKDAFTSSNSSAELVSGSQAVENSLTSDQSSSTEERKHISMYRSKLLTVTVNGTVRQSESKHNFHKRVKRGLENSFRKAQQREHGCRHMSRRAQEIQTLPSTGNISNESYPFTAEIFEVIDKSSPMQNETQILFLMKQGRTIIDAWQAKKTYDSLNETELEFYLSYEIVRPIIPWEATLLPTAIVDSPGLYKTVISSLLSAFGMILCLSMFFLLYIVARSRKRRSMVC